MGIRWIDVTIPLEAETTVWPGDPAFEIAPASRISDGSSCNTSRVSLSTHTGTHIDAPWHFIEEGLRLDQVNPTVFFGEAMVLEVPGVPIVTASDLGAQSLPSRILIKTDNSSIPYDAPFNEGFVALAADAAQRLVDEGVRLVGIDYLSIAPFRAGREVHQILLGNNILPVEGLRLRRLRPGTCQFVVLPLHVVGADGAPCRAFVGVEEME